MKRLTVAAVNHPSGSMRKHTLQYYQSVKRMEDTSWWSAVNNPEAASIAAE